ncbi:MAG: DUF1684 domain-containing protein, partial [Bacteroidota bacterium]
GRVQNLKKEQGWLSLTSLQWIREGKNNIKSIGTITLRKGTVSLSLDRRMKGTLGGKTFRSGRVMADKDKVLIGSKAVSVIKRGDKFAVRVWDSEYPARKHFKTIDRYPVSDAWKIEARWTQYAEPKKIQIATVVPGLLQEGSVPGVAVFTLQGKECRLEPTVEEGEKDYFFVFGDKTNGKETYGAGRFLYAESPANGTIILDFNKSYNPPCAFTDFATCPVPSRENRLPVRIEAGEKNYQRH